MTASDSYGDVVAFVAADESGRIVSANRGFQRLLGYDAVDVIGRPVTSLVPAMHRRDLAERVEACFSSSEAAELHLPVSRADGTLRRMAFVFALSELERRRVAIIAVFDETSAVW